MFDSGRYELCRYSFQSFRCRYANTHVQNLLALLRRTYHRVKCAETYARKFIAICNCCRPTMRFAKIPKMRVKREAGSDSRHRCSHTWVLRALRSRRANFIKFRFQPIGRKRNGTSKKKKTAIYRDSPRETYTHMYKACAVAMAAMANSRKTNFFFFKKPLSRRAVGNPNAPL